MAQPQNHIPSNTKSNQADTQSVPNDDIYETLKNQVINGQITNLSFKNLAKTLGVHNNKHITVLRDRLVTEKLAMYDHTRKCLPIPK